MPKQPSKSKKKQPSNSALRRSQRKDAGSIECPQCGKVINRRGVGPHRKSCAGKIDELEDRSNQDLAIADPAFNNLLVRTRDSTERNFNAAYQSAEMAEFPSQEPGEPLESDDESEETSDISMPERILQQPEQIFDIESDSDDEPEGLADIVHPIPVQGDTTSNNSTYIPCQNSSQPEKDEIRVEYHPSSGQQPQHFSFDDYQEMYGFSADDIPLDNTATFQDEPKNQRAPWWPFSSQLDFEIAELIQETHMNEQQTNSLIELINKCIKHSNDFTLKNNKDIKSIWQTARTRTSSFVNTTISVPYPHPTSETKVEFNMWSRSLWDWCSELLSDTSIVSQFRWNAERTYKYNSGMDKFERCITEPWTADSWWKAQDRIPAGGVPICIILYADKTQLSSFGTAKGYPVLARCANLPIKLRNGTGLAGGRLVGWLPIVKEDAGETRKKRFINLKRVVWHEGFRKVLESIIQYSKTGIPMFCGDKIRRWLFPLILILSADYEEQCFMALIRGINSSFPCPICLVSGKDLSDLLQPIRLRTSDAMKQVYTEAQALSAGQKDAKLKSYGLRDVENIFWSLYNTDVYSALCWDRLHAYTIGLFGSHLWEQLKIVVDILGRESAKLIDSQVDAIPRWRGLNHFSTLLKTSDFTDGNKYEDISKIIVFGSHNILNQTETPRGYLLLKIIRSYLELDMYSSLTLHTESTLKAGRRELVKFDTLLKMYAESYPEKSWNFPKAHTHQHMFDDIQNKGVTRNFNTKPSESAHRPLKKFYMHHTNFKNVDPQILRLEENTVVSMMIRDEIDSFHERQSSNNDLSNSDVNDYNNLILQHVVLGSSLSWITLKELEIKHSTDLGFRDLRKKTMASLTAILSAEKGRYQKVVLTENHEIQPHQFIKVFYKSSIDCSIQHDILRVNPNFHNRPRNDYVLIQAHEDDYVFAQLLQIFSIKYKDRTHHLALIWPMDNPVPLLSRGRDRDLRFTRVVARPRSSSVLVDIETIVRGALLVKDYASQFLDEHIVLDVIDTDLWWRMKEIKLAQKVVFAH